MSRYNGTVLYGKDQAAVQLFATALPAFIMAPIFFMASFIFFAASWLALPVEFAAAIAFIASVRFPVT